ncbi:hypothetical protein L484_011862 [Morus notabilis]|uniref:Uncharacterized protein n=1 Tax=Morus notabilis TaxID=981085 RepID=W9S1U4_9ROSA|nr:hypothetical protein L484_011862 [Morus notabilis]
MALRIKTLVILASFLLLTIPLLNSGIVEGFNKANNPIHSLHQETDAYNFQHAKDGKRMINWRKLLMPDAFLDYDDAEPNPRHDPSRRKRPNP